jgi:hypothetical protein
MCPIIALNVVANKNIPSLAGILTPVVRIIASQFTEFVIPAHNVFAYGINEHQGH